MTMARTAITMIATIIALQTFLIIGGEVLARPPRKS